MNSLFFVVCLVAIACASAVALNYLKLRAEREQKEGVSEEAAAQIEALEERIRVLERIITENRVDLKDEIDRL